MSLAPLLAAPWLVQVHVAAALAAIVLGLVQFTCPKGTAAHCNVVGAGCIYVK